MPMHIDPQQATPLLRCIPSAAMHQSTVQVVDFIGFFNADFLINLSKPRSDAAQRPHDNGLCTKLSTKIVDAIVPSTASRLRHNRPALH